jgi:hypothetical protein
MMNCKFSLSFLECFMLQIAYAQIPVVYSGKLIHFPQFKSAYVEPRNIDIWVPHTITSNDTFDVIYMHNGHMLFDSNFT